MGNIGVRTVHKLPASELKQFAVSSRNENAPETFQQPVWKRLLVAARICAENQNPGGANALYRDALLSVQAAHDREEVMAFINDELWSIQIEVLKDYLTDGH